MRPIISSIRLIYCSTSFTFSHRSRLFSDGNTTLVVVEVALEGGPLSRKFYMVYHKNKFFTNALLDLKEICLDLEVTLPA